VAKKALITVYFALFTVYGRGGVGWKRHMGGRRLAEKSEYRLI